ncbi:MAG: hypothetical protein ACLRMN_08180 [Mediterraneibacter gnavus]
MSYQVRRKHSHSGFWLNRTAVCFKKAIAVSGCMVIPMVIIMSFYGGVEACIKSGEWGSLLLIWLTNIPKNFIMALPFQLLIAGPLVRKVFRTAFPEGTVLLKANI